MRNALHLSETSTTVTKSKKTAELASLGRQLAVPMKCSAPVSPSSVRPLPEPFSEDSDDLPWSVSRAAQFLGVSPQTVYLWVERKQIPHLSVMGRNIRFLRVDLERFRATFRREPGQFKMSFFQACLSGPHPPQSFPHSRTELGIRFRSKRSYTDEVTP